MTKQQKSTKQRTKKKGGRPKAATRKSLFVSFRVTQEEMFALASKAQRSAMSPGEFARSRSLRGIARGKKPAPAMPQVFGEFTHDLYHELRRQGVLLNQIAKHCNTHQVPPPLEMLALADTLMTLWQRLQTAEP